MCSTCSALGTFVGCISHTELAYLRWRASATGDSAAPSVPDTRGTTSSDRRYFWSEAATHITIGGGGQLLYDGHVLRTPCEAAAMIESVLPGRWLADNCRAIATAPNVSQNVAVRALKVGIVF